MAPVKFLLALCSLAIFSATLNATPANALSVEGHHVSRHVAHDSIAKRKRDTSSRCKPRGGSSSSTPPASSTPVEHNDTPASSTPASSSSHKPSPSSSSPPAASSPPSTPAANPSGSGSKLGIAWALGDDERLKLLAPPEGQTRLLFNWNPTKPPLAVELGFTFVAQLWGDKQVNTFVKTVVAGYAKYAMGMNEPNQSGQSDMSPDHGAYLWKTYVAPLRSQGYKLLSPPTTSAPDGLTWVQNMVKACDGQCDWDYTATHWYDTTIEKFQTYVELWHTTFQKPVMITEFACQNFNGGAQPSNDEIWSFYAQAVEWLEKTSYVAAYMPFGFMDDMSNVNPANSLFKAGGLSDLGWLVVNKANGN